MKKFSAGLPCTSEQSSTRFKVQSFESDGSSRGALMVEATLVLGIILIFVFVGLEVSRYMAVRAVAQSAAQDAAAELAVDIRLSPDDTAPTANATRLAGMNEIRRRAQARVLASNIVGPLGSGAMQALTGGFGADVTLNSVGVSGPVDPNTGALINPMNRDQEDLYSTTPFEVTIAAQFQPMFRNFISIPFNFAVANRSVVYREPRLAYAYPAAGSCTTITSGINAGRCVCNTSPNDPTMFYNSSINICQCGPNMAIDPQTGSCACQVPNTAATPYIRFDSTTGSCKCDVAAYKQYCLNANTALFNDARPDRPEFCFCVPCEAAKNVVLNTATGLCDCTITPADCAPDEFVFANHGQCVCQKCLNGGSSRGTSCDCSTATCPAGMLLQDTAGASCGCYCDNAAGFNSYNNNTGCAPKQCVENDQVNLQRCHFNPNGSVSENG